MTRDEGRKLIEGASKEMEDGFLPDLEGFTPERKRALLWACRLIDTDQKKEFVAGVLADVKGEKDARAFGVAMRISRALILAWDVVLFLKTGPGAILAAVSIYLISGGDKQFLLDMIKAIFK